MKSRKKKRSLVPVIVLTVLLLVTISVVGFFYYFGNYFKLKGNWSRNIDCSAMAADRAEDYLSIVLVSGDLALEDFTVEDYFRDIVIEVDLSINSSKNYIETIDTISYENASSNALESLKRAMQDILTSKLLKLDVADEFSIEDLANEVLGMSLDDYLKEYGPELLPDLKELSISNNVEGMYSYGRDTLYFSTVPGMEADESNPVTYMVSDDELILKKNGENLLYHNVDRQEE